MRWGRITQKSVEQDRIVKVCGAVDEVPAIANHHVEFFRFAVEILLRHRHDGGVDFDNIHRHSLAGQLRRDDPHAHTDTQHAVNPRRVGARQIVEHISEERGALFLSGVINVLRQEIIQVRPPRAAVIIDDLQQPEVGIAAELFHPFGGRPVVFPANTGVSAQHPGHDGRYHSRFVA